MKTNKAILPLVLLGMMTLAPPSYAMSERTMEFIPMSASSSAFEIESSRLALHKSHNPRIREFAQEMITDHTNAAGKMRAILMTDRMPPAPPGYDDRQIHILNKLHSLRGADFDAAYVRQQEKAHMDAINLFTDYADNGENRDLKKFAEKTLPILRHHKQMIDQIGENR